MRHQGLLVFISIASVFMFVVLWKSLQRISLRRQRKIMRRAHQLFLLRREWLEARFLAMANQSGVPRGLAWNGCEFDSDVTFARDRQNRQLCALVGVTISFEAIKGGDMEDVEAVGNLRAATAVFRFGGSQWHTDGRAIFNLNPDETIRHFQHELEAV